MSRLREIAVEHLEKAETENRRLRTVIERAVEVLEIIAGRVDKTMLADCCVDRRCQPHYEANEFISACSYQSGVSRGFGESGYEAKEALADLRKALGVEGK